MANGAELIMFYNTENLYAPEKITAANKNSFNSVPRKWSDLRFRDKLQKIASVFSLMQEQEGIVPLFAGLSEIQGRTVLEELLQLLPSSDRYDIIHYESPDERGVDVALLYDKTKMEILNSEPLSFFFEIEDNNPENYDTTRDVLFCRARYREEIINIFVCHLPSKREQDINKPKRAHILQAIRGKINQITENTGEAVIVCGDFNENPDEENLSVLLVGPGGKPDITNPFGVLFTEKMYSTYHHQSGLLFDQILLSSHFFRPDSTLAFASAGVFNHPKISSTDRRYAGRPFRTYAGTRYLGGYSDHFPVYIKFNQ